MKTQHIQKSKRERDILVLIRGLITDGFEGKMCFTKLSRLKSAGVQPPQDPGEPEGKTASADDLERDKERIL